MVPNMYVSMRQKPKSLIIFYVLFDLVHGRLPAQLLHGVRHVHAKVTQPSHINQLIYNSINQNFHRGYIG